MLFDAISQMQVNALHGFVTLTGFCIALVAAITFHEFSHALSATSLGDYTARSLGRLSLHPKVHLDPIGTTMILLAGFGWGKPTPVNPRYLRPGERPGMAAVAMAGPISNVLLAFVATIPMKLGLVSRDYSAFILFRGEAADIVAYVLGALVFWNLLLAAFNLIPVAPLERVQGRPRNPAQGAGAAVRSTRKVWSRDTPGPHRSAISTPRSRHPVDDHSPNPQPAGSRSTR